MIKKLKPTESVYFATGRWLPDVDPAKIGHANFSTMQNLRYSDSHPVAVSGMRRMNFLPLERSIFYPAASGDDGYSALSGALYRSDTNSVPIGDFFNSAFYPAVSGDDGYTSTVASVQTYTASSESCMIGTMDYSGYVAARADNGFLRETGENVGLGEFTGASQYSDTISVPNGATITITVAGSWTGNITLYRSYNGGSTWVGKTNITSSGESTQTESSADAIYRLKTITFSGNASARIAVLNAGGGVNATDITNSMLYDQLAIGQVGGELYQPYLLFTLRSAIPAGATITSAYMYLTSWGGSAGSSIATKVYCAEDASPSAPTTGAEFGALSLTTGTDWDWTHQAATTLETSSDITAEVQEVVSTVGSVSSLLVVVKDDGTANGVRGVFYAGGNTESSTYVPQILIKYTT